MAFDRGRGSNGQAPASAAPGSQHGEPAAQLIGVASESPTRGGALTLATEPLQNAKCASFLSFAPHLLQTALIKIRPRQGLALRLTMQVL
jgi:hypothetical protein